MKKKKFYSGLMCIVIMGSMAFPSFAANGWEMEGSSWKYAGPEGYVTNDWSFIDSQWYHFDEKGHMQTGWVKESEGWYYLGLDGILGAGGTAVDSQGRAVQPFSGDGSYFVDGDSYIFNPETDYNMIFSSGNMNDTKVIAALKGVVDASLLNSRETVVYEKADAFLKNQIFSTDSNYEKAHKIYNYIKQTAVYQDTERMDDDCPYSILVDGIGICGGFARTYKVLANGAGLECKYEGDAIHAWNQVYTDSWKWIDVSSTGQSADFYLKSNRYSCDGCGWSGILPPRNYYTCPCGNTFGADE